MTRQKPEKRRCVLNGNGFEVGFQRLLEEADDHAPLVLTEARFAGPWEVEARGEQWAVSRAGDPRPLVVTEARETACMIAAVLVAVGREPVYDLANRDLRTSCGDRGFSPVARFEGMPEEALLRPLHVAHCLLVDPVSLAWLLRAAPTATLERVGQLLSCWPLNPSQETS